MNSVSGQAIYLRPGEKRWAGIDFTQDLETGETLTGTPSVVSADCTIATPTVNVAAFKNKAKGTCAISKGVRFYITAPATQGDYSAVIDVDTTTGARPSWLIPVIVRTSA